jgi:hypothetical protein
MQNAVHLLQQWYADQCDGDWEHSYGIKLDTLDNPGWILKIDLQDTEWEKLSLPLVRTYTSDQDWKQFEVCNACFTACGDPSKLSLLIEDFLRTVWPHRLEG